MIPVSKIWFYSIHNTLFIHWYHLRFENHCTLTTSIHIILVNLLIASRTIYTKITWLFIFNNTDVHNTHIPTPQKRKKQIFLLWFLHIKIILFSCINTSAISFRFSIYQKTDDNRVCVDFCLLFCWDVEGILPTWQKAFTIILMNEWSSNKDLVLLWVSHRYKIYWVLKLLVLVLPEYSITCIYFVGNTLNQVYFMIVVFKMWIVRTQFWRFRESS